MLDSQLASVKNLPPITAGGIWRHLAEGWKPLRPKVGVAGGRRRSAPHAVLGAPPPCLSDTRGSRVEWDTKGEREYTINQNAESIGGGGYGWVGACGDALSDRSDKRREGRVDVPCK